MKEYFSHDLNARNDRKLVKLAMKHGMTGLGTFWCIVEMLFEEEGRIMLSECERIAFELRVQSDLVFSVLQDFELFQMDEEWFWSDSVNKRIEAQILVSNGAKKAAKTRWERFRNQKDDADAMRSHSEPIPLAMQEKESKEKESKGKETNTGGDAPRESFSKPSQDEIAKYVLEKNPTGNPEGAKTFAIAFWSHYENNGWKVGKNKMKNWTLAIVQWKDTLQKHIFPNGQPQTISTAPQQIPTPDLPNYMRGIEYSRSGYPNKTFKGNYNEYMDAVGCTPDEEFTIVREYVIQYP